MVVFQLRLNPSAVLALLLAATCFNSALVFGQEASPGVASSQDVDQYLNATHSAFIDRVVVGVNEISIEGHVPDASENTFLIGDISIETVIGAAMPHLSFTPIDLGSDGRFQVQVPRKIDRDGTDHDRLLSRWQIVKRTTQNVVPVSHAKYATEVDLPERSRAPQLRSKRNKKGLGGWNPSRAPRLPTEIGDLGVSHVTVNLPGLHRFVTPRPHSDWPTTVWQGKTYFVNERALRKYDAVFAAAERQGVHVSVILLITNPAKTNDSDAKTLGHPGATKDGVYGMPNVTNRDGVETYGAILDVISKRWSQPGTLHGRVDDWIIHNEVDAGWTWTNAGRISDLQFMDLYVRSMRMSDLIWKQYSSTGRVFISLTHHWAEKGRPEFYGSRRCLELLTDFCRAEGDFNWGLAYHPYPQNLRNPRTWEDDQATFETDTRKITPRNIEVLDAYMKQPSMRFGGEMRPIYLSENGFNSKDYTPKSLKDQAAGMVFAWKKIERLPSVKVWHYHNWIDNRHEGGLRIGLRRFPDASEDPLGKKPIWNVYQALGTPKQKSVIEPYRKHIGINDWSEIQQRKISSP